MPRNNWTEDSSVETSPRRPEYRRPVYRADSRHILLVAGPGRASSGPDRLDLLANAAISCFQLFQHEQRRRAATAAIFSLRAARRLPPGGIVRLDAQRGRA
jgi:hypothetical protein